MAAIERAGGNSQSCPEVERMCPFWIDRWDKGEAGREMKVRRGLALTSWAEKLQRPFTDSSAGQFGIFEDSVGTS